MALFSYNKQSSLVLNLSMSQNGSFCYFNCSYFFSTNKKGNSLEEF